VAPTNRRQQRQQNKWWHETLQFITLESNNQSVAPINQLAARKAAKASVFQFLKSNNQLVAQTNWWQQRQQSKW